jgi:hypothetical protein
MRRARRCVCGLSWVGPYYGCQTVIMPSITKSGALTFDCQCCVANRVGSEGVDPVDRCMCRRRMQLLDCCAWRNCAHRVYLRSCRIAEGL